MAKPPGDDPTSKGDAISELVQREAEITKHEINTSSAVDAAPSNSTESSPPVEGEKQAPKKWFGFFGKQESKPDVNITIDEDAEKKKKEEQNLSNLGV